LIGVDGLSPPRSTFPVPTRPGVDVVLELGHHGKGRQSSPSLLFHGVAPGQPRPPGISLAFETENLPQSLTLAIRSARAEITDRYRPCTRGGGVIRPIPAVPVRSSAEGTTPIAPGLL